MYRPLSGIVSRGTAFLLCICFVGCYTTGVCRVSDSQLGFRENISLKDLERIKLPRVATMMSTEGLVRSAPALNSAVISHFPVGAPMEIVSFEVGRKVRRDCVQSPFDGCVASSDVWAQVRIPREAKTPGGLLPTVDFAWPSLSTTYRKIEDIFEWEHLEGFGTQWGRRVEHWKLPSSDRPSFLDNQGRAAVMPKITWRSGHLIASMRDIEFLRRAANRARPAGYRYLASARVSTTHPPVGLHTIEFLPPLSALLVTADSAKLHLLNTLEAENLFWSYPSAKNLAVPFLYKLPPSKDSIIVVVLLSQDAATKIDETKVSVSTEVTESRSDDMKRRGETTRIDLYGNGHPELLRFHSREQRLDCVPGDECGEGSYTQLAALIDGLWYVRGWAGDGMDGPEGY